MIDTKILAARCSTSPERAYTALDKIFVRNFTMDCRIGLYDEEMTSAQRVRFSVDMEILPLPRPMQDSAEYIVDYEMIVTVIISVANEGHINLMETLAERIASGCLAIPRAAKVRVLVEKLDRYEGASLGVEIERVRPAGATADVLPLPAARAVTGETPSSGNRE